MIYILYLKWYKNMLPSSFLQSHYITSFSSCQIMNWNFMLNLISLRVLNILLNKQNLKSLCLNLFITCHLSENYNLYSQRVRVYIIMFHLSRIHLDSPYIQGTSRQLYICSSKIKMLINRRLYYRQFIKQNEKRQALTLTNVVKIVE